MKYLIITILIFSACKSSTETTLLIEDSVDLAIKKSSQLNDSSVFLLNVADKKTEIIVKEVIKKVDKLKDENVNMRREVESLNQKMSVTKATIIRDTVFITEKKNFWGKTKITTDSSSTVIEDSTENK
jgi:ribosomal protein L25 (general stress protein Ctc)